MNLDTLIRLLDIGGNTASAARRARDAAQECALAKAGMEKHYPARVEAGTMDSGEAAVKIWQMGHAAEICNAVADALARRAETEASNEDGLFAQPAAGGAE